MIWFFMMQIPSVGYCAAYMIHSVKARRYRQGAAVGILTGIGLAASALLLWEFLAVP